MNTRQLKRIVILLVACCLLVVTGIAVLSASQDDGELVSRIPAGTETSHRLIVQLESPSLAEWMTAASTSRSAQRINQIDASSSAAQAYVSALEAEQSAFVASLSSVLPTAKTTGYINESGREIAASYQIVANAIAIDPGTADIDSARRILSQVDGVRAVYRDYAHYPTTYTSTQLINAPILWDTLGGQADAGRGVKVASVDGGLHHDAAMFDGTDFSYPGNYPSGGLGDQSNNNGKIIASRVYFRSWDPPAMGEDKAWPGPASTSHGVHTASTAAGNPVMANYLGTQVPNVSGVAPGAWVMSYRVFYASVNDIQSFYTVEGLAALEDAVADGADVINNSWGGGPASVGGEFDLLDTGLRNAAAMDVFVSMSAGNAGPGEATGDHPSDDYINVAATTSGGTFAAGELNVTSTMSETLQGLPFSGSTDFGPELEFGSVFSYSVTWAGAVDSANVEGCAPFPAGAFDGKTALISRGTCFFSDKAFNAQEAGAEFVVIYNNDGDDLINLSFGSDFDPELITITSIFVGQTDGEAMVALFEADGELEIEVDTVAQQVGNEADQVASFSSRGPAAGGLLKPDIGAPGVNILAQGYANADGEATHLGYGQVSGTSMAAPHVAGAAALIRAIHPGWSNDMIKSAMMSTAKYMDVYNTDGSPAQPLDFGAGRLDLTNVADVDLMFDPPSLSFSDMMTGSSKTLAVNVMNISDSAATYDVSTAFTGGGFMTVTAVAGMSVSPATIVLAPGESTTFEVTFDSTMGMMGDNQGYVVLMSSGADGMMLSMPAWARVNPQPPAADILFIDNDFSDLPLGYTDYTAYYTQTLDNLGYSYDYYSADANFGSPVTLPPAEQLRGYKAIILQTGDHYESDGTFGVSTPLTELDMDILTEYANYGGFIIVMGQDASSSMNGADGSDNNPFFFDTVLGGDDDILQDSVSDFAPPDGVVASYAGGIPALRGVTIDLSAPVVDTMRLTPLAEVPPVTGSTTTGSASVSYDAVNMLLSYDITITPGMSAPITVTAAHIHTGTLGTNGGVLYNIFPFTDTQFVTDSLSFSGSTTIVTTTHEAALLTGDLYFNIHTEQNPGGELRAQIVATASGDGAGNQLYVDELDPHHGEPEDEELVISEYGLVEGLGQIYMPILRYPHATNIDEGTVAMAHRDQPSLERPGTTYAGASIFAGFGLEGVNNGTGHASREAVLGAFLAWGWDEPMATITQTATITTVNALQFEVGVTSNMGAEGWKYRWDFGDGSPILTVNSSPVMHEYDECPTNPVRVEAIDTLGNVTIEVLDPADIVCDITPVTPPVLQHHYYLPMVVTAP